MQMSSALLSPFGCPSSLFFWTLPQIPEPVPRPRRPCCHFAVAKEMPSLPKPSPGARRGQARPWVSSSEVQLRLRFPGGGLAWLKGVCGKRLSDHLSSRMSLPSRHSLQLQLPLAGHLAGPRIGGEDFQTLPLGHPTVKGPSQALVQGTKARLPVSRRPPQEPWETPEHGGSKGREQLLEWATQVVTSQNGQQDGWSPPLNSRKPAVAGFGGNPDRR